MRGRKPAPVDVLDARGNLRQDRRRAAIPQPGPIHRPDKMSKAAVAEWRRIVPLLGDVVGKLDAAVLVLYCECYSIFRMAVAQIAKEGITTDNARGEIVRHPAVQIAAQAHGNMLRCIETLGLSPVSRTRLNLPTAPGVADDFEKFVAKKRNGKK